MSTFFESVPHYPWRGAYAICPRKCSTLPSSILKPSYVYLPSLTASSASRTLGRPNPPVIVLQLCRLSIPHVEISCFHADRLTHSVNLPACPVSPLEFRERMRPGRKERKKSNYSIRRDHILTAHPSKDTKGTSTVAPISCTIWYKL